MSNRQEAIKMIKNKIDGNSYYTFEEIAEITGYHPKYILKMKKQILDGTITSVHGNTNRKPKNSISDEERDYIIKLYKHSNVSIRRFCQFYGKRSYSCIYNVLRQGGLIK